MLPICCTCKKIRDDDGYWKRIEIYLHNHAEVSFSHGFCHECAVKYYQENDLEVPADLTALAEDQANQNVPLANS